MNDLSYLLNRTAPNERLGDISLDFSRLRRLLYLPTHLAFSGSLPNNAYGPYGKNCNRSRFAITRMPRLP
jgi:hypothetical protein